MNSGSEANDLAMMMARLHTRRFDIISFRYVVPSGHSFPSRCAFCMSSQCVIGAVQPLFWQIFVFTSVFLLFVCVYHLFVLYNVGTIEYRSINKNKDKLSD